MDKTARLSAILTATKELVEKEEQAIYGANLALNTREWSHVLTCAKALVAVQEQRLVLNAEANQLQQQIEDESREVIL